MGSRSERSGASSRGSWAALTLTRSLQMLIEAGRTPDTVSSSSCPVGCYNPRACLLGTRGNGAGSDLLVCPAATGLAQSEDDAVARCRLFDASEPLDATDAWLAAHPEARVIASGVWAHARKPS